VAVAAVVAVERAAARQPEQIQRLRPRAVAVLGVVDAAAGAAAQRRNSVPASAVDRGA
jgi:F0F1-type ATP synthase membrane subunit c/vacuolar-type H+-ATPase subunit K